MDLRVYYQKLRKIEAEITEPFVVLVSRETPDGGKAGVFTDVPRSTAARMMAEERADLASPAQAVEFRDGVERAWNAARAVVVTPVETVKAMTSLPRAGKK